MLSAIRGAPIVMVAATALRLPVIGHGWHWHSLDGADARL